MSLLYQSIDNVPGFTPKQLGILRKEAGINTLRDLLWFYPKIYLDKSKFHRIGSLHQEALDTQFIQIKGRVLSKTISGVGRKQRLSVVITDGSGTAELVWFNYIRWRYDKIALEGEYKVFGPVKLSNQSVIFAHPEMQSFTNIGPAGEYLQSVYRLSEVMRKHKLTDKAMSEAIAALLKQLSGQIEEYIPAFIKENHQLISLAEAFQNIHFPKNKTDIQKAQVRLKFEELFLFQTKILKSKMAIKVVNRNGYIFEKLDRCFNTVYNNLPFALTPDQEQAIKDIRKDVLSPLQMNRLVQGDVGSGKTIVAIFAMLFAIDNGYQACLMAPTEILAQQQFQTLKEITATCGVKVALITGSTPKKERAEILQSLAEGEINVLVGTHALIQPSVQFKNLGLAIIDEQHKFGVAQRSALWTKNRFPPHLLVLTATPIPRTLAMTAYGNLDISIISSMPAGRKPIITTHRYENSRLKVFHFIKEQIKEGHQAYVVYPLIEESSKLDLLNLMEGYKYIQECFKGSNVRIGLLHGKLPVEEKELQMQKFKHNEIQLLVSTPVIEVGIDVPNATVMLIESANRFGIAQLHQLRGRIGRSDKQSYCVLMTNYNISKEARIKIDTLVRTNNGFEIADADLKLRGPGEFDGVKQSGILEFKVAKIYEDAQLVELTRNYVTSILERDPELKEPEHAGLKRFIMDLEGNSLSRVS